MVEPTKNTIMVVENDAEAREGLKRSLGQEGFLVLDMESGKKALELAAKVAVDLLVTDVFLPSLSARELSNRMAMINPRLKVIFLSNYPSALSISHGICPEGATILQKPVLHRILLGQVYSVLESGTYWTQLSTGSGVRRIPVEQLEEESAYPGGSF